MFMLCLTTTIMFSSVFFISPQRATLWLALVCLPEGLVFLYGMFSDCVTMFGSQRRVYICVMSVIQLATAAFLARSDFSLIFGEIEFAILVSICVMSRAWLTPVIESLMLIQMKRDPDYGADDLETFGMLCEAMGTVFYCILGGYIIAWNEETPNVFFWLICGTGAITFIAGCWYPQESDEIDERFDRMGTWDRTKEKFSLFWEAVTLPEVRNLLIFFGIVSLVGPNLEEFLIYYNEGMCVTPLFEGAAEVVLFVAGAAIFLMYNNYVMSKSEVGATAFVAILARVVSALYFAWETSHMGYTTHGHNSAKQTLMIQAGVVRSFVDAFLYLPGMIMYTKMVPHHIEGMMIGFAWGLIKFNFDVLGRLITVGLNQKFMVMGEAMPEPGEMRCGRVLIEGNEEMIEGPVVEAQEMAALSLMSPTVFEESFGNLYKMYLIQAGMVAFPIFFIWMVARRYRVEEVQMAIHHKHHHSKNHPDSAQVSIAETLAVIRETKQIHATVNNDFPQFVQLLKEADNNQNDH